MVATDKSTGPLLLLILLFLLVGAREYAVDGVERCLHEPEASKDCTAEGGAAVDR